MPKGTAFEYLILYHPEEKKDAAGNPTERKKSELIVGPKLEIALSAQEVGILAAKAIPDTHIEHLDRIEVIIRPFKASQPQQ